MNRLYILLLFFTGLTGFAFSPPPVITDPSPYAICDNNNDGIAAFDLTTKISEILGALNPSLYTVSFHETATDAEIGTSPITPLNAYTNITPYTQYLYVRVTENANPTQPSMTELQLNVNASILGTITTLSGDQCGDARVTFHSENAPGPVIFTYALNNSNGPVQTVVGNPDVTLTFSQNNQLYFELYLLSVESIADPNACSQVINGFVGVQILPIQNTMPPNNLTIQQPTASGETAAFNLENNTPVMLNGLTDLTVSYYTSLDNASEDSTPISNTTNYVAAYGTQIWARLENAAGCFTTKSFFLYVSHPETDYVFIPDTVFKAKLLSANATTNQFAQNLAHNYTVVDTNGDGQIQYTEAANISLLNVSNNSQAGIADLTGIEAFINLASLDASSNREIRRVNTPALSNLTYLNVNFNQIVELDLSNLPLLQTVNASSCSLTSLDFSNNPLMTSISCSNNSDNTGRTLATLNLTGLTLLTELDAQSNVITTLNTTDLHSMVNLYLVGSTGLTTLDLSQMPNLATLNCQYSSFLANINLTGCSNLTSLTCGGTSLTSLDVSDSPLLTSLSLTPAANQLTTLDLSHNPILCNLVLEGPLNWINLKNGVDSCYTNFIIYVSDNGFLCCDDNEVAYFQNYFSNQFGNNMNINSYCSFTPGGDYNTITVGTQFDANGNGCDVNDGGYPNLRLNINDQTNQGATFTNSNGGGFFYTQAGNFTITPSVENPTWFGISPQSAEIQFSNTNQNTTNQNFCIAPVGVHRDLEIVIAPLTSARPGFDATYKILVKNKGNQIISRPDDGILFLYDYNKMHLVSVSEPVSLFEGPEGTLAWDILALSPFESKTITVTLNVNPPTDPNFPVNIDDVLTFNATANPTAGDETPSDNVFQFNQIVIGSFDPNEMICLEGDIVSPIEIGNYLHYAINFENTGNADAENVVVRDIINPAQFDINSLQLLGSSASVTTRISGNVAEFIFPSINLHSGGHGNILLKVRTNNTLNEGDIVSKTANIYFDYNFPVVTDPENTIFQALSNPDVPVDTSISIYPNPTKGNVTINCNSVIKSVSLYDVQGRLLQTNMVNENQSSLDISNHSGGVYFVKIVSDAGMKVQKIVKE